MPLPIPKQVPKLGFYYHYKHDPKGPINNYAYEVIGVGFHTEDDPRPGEAHFVIYRPLYEASVYKASKDLNIPCFDSRPLEMWIGNIEKEGKSFHRFAMITDPMVISGLERIKREMYS